MAPLRTSLKPFVLNLSDLGFLLRQVTFRPLFDQFGNAIINWDGTSAIFDDQGTQIWNGVGLTPAQAIAVYGASYAHTTELTGVRDVSGLNNNLLKINQTWGSVDQPFPRTVPADFADYMKPVDPAVAGSYGALNGGFDLNFNQPGNQYAPMTNYAVTFNPTGAPIIQNVVDYTPRMISRTTTTGGATPLLDVQGHIVNWDPALYASSTPPGLAYKAMIVASGVDISGLIDGAAVITDYGLLEALGHQDYNNPTNGEFFIGAENPGVAPSNSWFAYFGQFFDHGLDLISKDSGKTIKIALAKDDPLYGVVGPDGRPATSITISRADVSGVDANGDPTYKNHTSPFIDQSQTYGSHEQMTNLLREWVSSDNGATFHAGMELFDGDSLATAWTDAYGNTSTRTLPTLNELRHHVEATARDALTWEDVLDLRNRNANGDLADSNLAAAGIQTTNSGQALLLDMNPIFDRAQLLPTNDGYAAKVDAAIATLSAEATAMGGTFGWNSANTLQLTFPSNPALYGPMAGQTVTGASALYLWVNFANFSITATDPAVHAAVGEILMASVGDHYIAGDGRVNENFGLTSIHHVFHEEHNFQVQNLINAILAEDATLAAASATDLAAAAAAAALATNTAATAADAALAATNAIATATAAAAAAAQDPADAALAATAAAAANDAAQAVANVVKLTTTAEQAAANAKALAVYDHSIAHSWQVNTGDKDAAGNFTHGAGGPIAWDQQKVFEATKLIVEMEYQHAAVDQYARTVTPRIKEFVGYSSDIDSTVTLEYAQAAFRFGHSTIRETIDIMDPNGSFTGQVMSFALRSAFLNPDQYAASGPAAITMGMMRQQMNEVDEFITPALNQGLLGMPLDLAAINIARGRDLGIPTLNEFRAGLGLTTYTSWSDFGLNMIHPESLTNFIAAYAFDGNVAKAQAIVGLNDGLIAEGSPAAMGFTLNQAIAFMSNDSTTSVVGQTSFNFIDTWIGGLAEAHVPGGLLGETFDAVFVDQIERLMDGDRFYYLYRLVNQQFGEEVNNGQFKDIVERNTGLTHLNGSAFAYADQYYDFSETGTTNFRIEHKYGQIIAANPTANGGDGLGIFSDAGASTNTNGTIVTLNGQQYIRDFRPEHNPSQVHTLEGTPTSGADSHEVIVGTSNVDYIQARAGDDTVYGEGGDDFIFGGGGVDRLYGGNGHDQIRSGEGPDLVDGGDGDDIIWGEGSGSEVGGFDQLVGGAGNDIIYGGEGIDKLSGGAGDDTIYGDANTDPFTHGGDGNDFIDGGEAGDNLYGDNGDDFIDGGADQDIIYGGDGDDILRPGKPGQAIGGGPDEVLGGDGLTDTGFDLLDLSDWAASPNGITQDLTQQANPLVAVDGQTPFPAVFQVEGVIATRNNDILIGTNRVAGADEGNSTGHDWLIGGSGNDTFTGNGGNDVIVGGSIRLDSLIGHYETAPGVADTYVSNWDGGSHRAAITSDLSASLLDNTALGTQVFDKHFTQFLQTAKFKDHVLGDNLADGAADKVILSGNWADYTIAKIVHNGITAYKLVDNGGLLAAGTPRLVNDGTDLVTGVELYQFADGVKTVENLFNPPPTDINWNGVRPAGSALPGTNAVFANLTTVDVDNTPVVWSKVGVDAFTVSSTGQVARSGGLTQNATYAVTVRADEALANGAFVIETINILTGSGGNNSGATALNGSALTDVIYALAGNDTLNGLGGNDTLFGQDGVDTLNGGTGNDDLTGGVGNDIINGDGGHDTIRWTFGDGNDTIDGGADTDRLVIAGTTGGETLNVACNGTTITQIEQGGSIVNVEQFTADLLGGTDTISYSPDTTVGVTVDLGAGTASGFLSIAGIENANGSSGNDTLKASSVANTLTGAGGNDTLIATVDNVRDTLNGGANNDTANYAAYAGALTVNLGSAAPIVVGGSGSNANNSDVLVAIENFTGGSGGDTITGNTAANALNGGLGNDIINYAIGGGIDMVDGGDGASDVLNITDGGGGNTLDVVWNGATFTQFEGGSVVNVELFSAAMGGGTDTVVFTGSTASVTVSLATPSATGFSTFTGVENVVGTALADFLSGGTGTNILTGGGGADTINMGTLAAEVTDHVRFGATADFGDTITNFDVNGTFDVVGFTGALNTAFDDGNNNNDFLFASGNGGAGTVTVTVGQANNQAEALMLTGANNEGVANTNLSNAALVAAAFNAEFVITAANGEDALLVINDTNGNSASMWQWVQAAGGAISADELTYIGTINANATIVTNNFDLF